MKALCVEKISLLLLCLMARGIASSNENMERLLSMRRSKLGESLNQGKQEIPEDMQRTYREINNRRKKDDHRQMEEPPASEEPPLESIAESKNIITVECTETPIFSCEEESVAVCFQKVQSQQDQVVADIQTQYPGATVVARTQKLLNAIFVDMPEGVSDNGLRSIVGVQQLSPHHQYEVTLEDTADYVGALAAREQFCATGRGVRVAVLDTGVDYTHELLGGSGSTILYNYALNRPANRDGFFPTQKIIAGYDFVGIPNGNSLVPDSDPIDGRNGHGTSVTSTILAIAPDADIVGVRVCLSRSCPELAILQGLEFALDPNGDGLTDDAVDIVNLSLGSRYFSSFNEKKSHAIEKAFEMGVLTVVAAGNNRNNPYIMGPMQSSPNALSVAATGHPSGRTENPGVMEFYSSRGPGENNAIKPDIAAPSGSFSAVAGTGNEVAAPRGTSFSAPVVAGAAALLKERCPSCSPLALKALLMNNAYREIKYFNATSINAPVTFVGSGELRIRDSLEADFWAYSPDEGDVQPSLSLGLVNAASDITISRTIKIVNLLDRSEPVSITTAFRDPADANSGALTITVNPQQIMLATCNSETTVTINFQIDANKAPPNHMGVGGDPSIPLYTGLDANEFDGHVIIRAPGSGKEIAMPFHVLLRRAANTTVSTTALPWDLGQPSKTNVAVQNVGAGVAQLEAFDLIGLSSDREEAVQGEKGLGDIRSVGFRTLEVREPGCTFLLEFLVNTWERHDILNPKNIFIALDVNQDNDIDFFLFNDFEGRSDVGVILDDLINGVRTCTGMPPDDPTNNRNTILRVCTDDVGFPSVFDATIVVGLNAGSLGIADFSGAVGVRVNSPAFSAPSYDIPPGATLGLTVSGSGSTTATNRPPLGLLLITNGFRADGNTGAATEDTETHLMLVNPFSAFPEITPDENKVFHSANDTTGPECLWQEDACTTPTASPVSLPPVISLPPLPNPPAPRPTRSPTKRPTCPPNVVPRNDIASWAPSVSPTLSTAPTLSLSPTASPSGAPTSSAVPSAVPTTFPTTNPTSAAASSRILPTSTWALFTIVVFALRPF